MSIAKTAKEGRSKERLILYWERRERASTFMMVFPGAWKKGAAIKNSKEKDKCWEKHRARRIRECAQRR